jgi:hypothetical protein
MVGARIAKVGEGILHPRLEDGNRLRVTLPIQLDELLGLFELFLGQVFLLPLNPQITRRCPLACLLPTEDD